MGIFPSNIDQYRTQDTDLGVGLGLSWKAAPTSTKQWQPPITENLSQTSVNYFTTHEAKREQIPGKVLPQWQFITPPWYLQAETTTFQVMSLQDCHELKCSTSSPVSKGGGIWGVLTWCSFLPKRKTPPPFSVGLAPQSCPMSCSHSHSGRAGGAAATQGVRSAHGSDQALTSAHSFDVSGLSVFSTCTNVPLSGTVVQLLTPTGGTAWWKGQTQPSPAL